ncbi:hypothetical protein ACFO5K_09255 [Nocardia halotolerans]|uniref:Uncharacterized protein n=1 Tax=Nocardia halotolerans TaxID=1755878 RepID=A0ABV8VG14_9NOCA
MTDHETGSGFTPGPGEKRFDAVERMRRKSAEQRAAEAETRAADGATNVVRLPKRPRRSQSEVGPARRWPRDGAYDPAPTRPVTRAELQRESATLPFEQVAPPGSGDNEQDADLIDLDASRRKRVGEDARPGRTRRMVRPRRVGHVESARGDGGESESSPDEPDH